MKPGGHHNRSAGDNESGVAQMIEYLMISLVLTSLLVVMMLLVNANFMEGPATTITYSAFTDISNGVSTRIVDTYAIHPVTGNITSRFDIPDEVAGRGYFVEVGNLESDDPTTQIVSISGRGITTNVAIGGIGSSQRAGGNTTSRGMNRIRFDSGGF